MKYVLRRCNKIVVCEKLVSMSYIGPVIGSPRSAGKQCLTIPKPETIRSSESWYQSTWLRGVNPPKLHIRFQMTAQTNQIPSNFRCCDWVPAGSQWIQFCSRPMFRARSIQLNFTHQGFSAFQNSLGWGRFLFLRRGKDSPACLSVLHDHSRQHAGTHGLVHSPTYTAGLTM